MGLIKNILMDVEEITNLVDAARFDYLDDYTNYNCYPTKRRMTIDAEGSTETLNGYMYNMSPVRVFVSDETYPVRIKVSAMPNQKAAAKALLPFLQKSSGPDVDYYGLT